MIWRVAEWVRLAAITHGKWGCGVAWCVNGGNCCVIVFSVASCTSSSLHRRDKERIQQEGPSKEVGKFEQHLISLSRLGQL